MAKNIPRAVPDRLQPSERRLAVDFKSLADGLWDVSRLRGKSAQPATYTAPARPRSRPGMSTADTRCRFQSRSAPYPGGRPASRLSYSRTRSRSGIERTEQGETQRVEEVLYRERGLGLREAHLRAEVHRFRTDAKKCRRAA